jgi:hypothetical protein
LAGKPKLRQNPKNVLRKKRLDAVINDKQNRPLDEFLKGIAYSKKL